MSSNTLNYASIAFDKDLSVRDDGRTLCIIQHQTLLDYAADQWSTWDLLGLLIIPFYMIWLRLTDPHLPRPDPDDVRRLAGSAGLAGAVDLTP